MWKWLWEGRRRNQVTPGVAKVVGARGVFTAELTVASRQLELAGDLLDLEPGTRVMVQCPRGSRLEVFRVEVLRAHPGSATLELPATVHRVERRSEVRDTACRGRHLRLDGRAATMLDRSEMGAKVMLERGPEPGARVRVELPDGGVAIAQAVETTDKFVRLRFDGPVPLVDDAD